MTNATSSRVDLLGAVTTPLGFFVLVVLVVEAGLIGLAATVGHGELAYLYAIVGLLGLLIGVVTLISVFRPEALAGKRFEPIRDELAENIARDVFDVLDGYIEKPRAAFSQLNQSCEYLASNRTGAEKSFVERFSQTIQARVNICGREATPIGHIESPNP
jgi:hypothetical protein